MIHFFIFTIEKRSAIYICANKDKQMVLQLKPLTAKYENSQNLEHTTIAAKQI